MNKSITLSEKDIARFWSKVEIGNPDECWEWKGAASKDGYGQFSVGNFIKRSSARSNRVSWTINFGEIPNGLFICHKCDNRSCVNPSHLFLGTPKDNMVDMARKGRTGVSLGEKHGISKLKEEQVLEIRKMLENRLTQREISEKFGVSQSAIYKIGKGLTWQDRTQKHG